MTTSDDDGTDQRPPPIGRCDLRRCADIAQETVVHPGRPGTWTHLCSFHAAEAAEVTAPGESAESTEAPTGATDN